MTKKERIEILLKEYAEIGTLLRAIDESIEVSPVLIDLIGDKAVHLSKNVQLLNQSDVAPAQPQVSSDDFDDEIDESFFIDGDLEYLQYELETEIARVTRSRPLDESVNNPWLANIDNVNGTPLKDYLKTDSKSEASASDENPVMVETIPQTELKEEKSGEV